MSNQAFSIETARHAAGIAVADGQGYRFFAAHPLFNALDRRHYGTLAAVQRAAVKREAELQQKQTSSRRQDSRGQVFRSWGISAEMA